MEDEDADEAMPALDGIDWVSQWLASTPYNPYVDELAEDPQSAFTFYDSDVSIGEGEEFEVWSNASTDSSDGPPQRFVELRTGS